VGTLGALAALLTAGALVIAWLVYASGKVDWLALRARLQPLPRLFSNGWYVDDAYSALLVTPGKAAAAFTAYVVDARGIDGIVNGIGGATRRLAGVGRQIQTGFVRSYALALFLGAVGIFVYVGLRL
jgi:NADH-quinone oxidoreductase subunit L